jgi:hypothetical protein
MGIIGRFWNWLTSSSTSVLRKGHPDLYPINVAKITKDLRIIEDAKRFGEAGLPVSDAVALTSTEAKVVQRVEKIRADYMDWAVLRMQVLSQNLAKHNVTHSVNRALQADSEFERRTAAILTDNENKLRRLSDMAVKRNAELEEFKVRNNITRDANPPLLGSFLRYALLVAGIIIEAILNAQFFSQGLSTGLIGGFGYAGSFAFLNITSAFLVGKFLIRYIFHRNGWGKFLGAFSICFAIILMLIIGLVIAHMRDALTAESLYAEKMALETLIASPLGLRDVMSWILLFISFLFASVALLDGLFSDDLYPGYGSISQRAELANDDYEGDHDELRSKLEELKDDQLKVFDHEVKETQLSVAAFEALIEDKKAAGSRLLNSLRDADNAMEALLRTFRTENELHRREIPRPRYFDEKPKLKPLPLPDFDTSADETSLDKQREMIRILLTEVQNLRANIQESFNRQFDRLKPLDFHFPRKEVV